MRISAFLLVLCAASAAVAAPAKPLVAIETAELSNGLRLAFVHVDSAPVVAVQVWYHAGSKDEPRDHRGLARLVEHLMFKGSDHVRSDAHQQMLQALGGYVHADLDEDSTHFIDTVPADYLEFALQLEADRMRHMMIRPTALAGERELVADEQRQRRTSPINAGFERFLGVAFTKHPYAWTSTGVPGELDKVAEADVKAFYDAYYQPNNALLVVAGKATFDQVKAAAEKYFGSIAKGGEPPRPSASAREPDQTTKRRELGSAGPVGLAIVGWHIPAAKDKDVYALQIASMLLGVGDGSRLKTRLKKIDPKTEAGVEAMVREEPGVLVALGVYVKPEQGDAIEAAIFEEVDRLAKNGPDAAELRRAKSQVQSGFTFSLEHAQGIAEAIGRSWILTGDPARFVRDLDEIEKVGSGDVKRVVKQYLAADRATVVAIPAPAAPAAPKKETK